MFGSAPTAFGLNQHRARGVLDRFRSPMARSAVLAGRTFSDLTRNTFILGLQLPDGYYHLDRMLDSAARHGADIGCCSTCMDARAIRDDMLTKGTRRSTLDG